MSYGMSEFEICYMILYHIPDFKNCLIILYLSTELVIFMLFSRVERGKIRVKLQLLEETVLPSSCYRPLVELLGDAVKVQSIFLLEKCIFLPPDLKVYNSLTLFVSVYVDTNFTYYTRYSVSFFQKMLNAHEAFFILSVLIHLC